MEARKMLATSIDFEASSRIIATARPARNN
jgi:hypothetical protein